MPLPKKHYLKILDKDGIEAIHGASMDVLQKVGVKVQSARGLRVLGENGYSVDEKTGIVKMTESQVVAALKSCKRNFRWDARREADSFDFVDGRTKFGPGAQCLYFIDPYSNALRQATLRDGILITRLLDALDTCSLGYMPTYPNDVQEKAMSAVSWAVQTVNSAKPSYGGSADDESWELMMKMIDIILGDRELFRKKSLFAGYIDPISPLGHDQSMVDILLRYSEHNQPVFVMVMALAGGTAPASLAGLLVQQNAEILSSIALARCVTKAPKIIYGSVSCPLDMRSGIAATGTPEFSLIGAASVQIGRSYGLPTDMGVQSDSKISDAQTSYEKMQSALMAVLSGADFAELFMGSTETFNAYSPIQLMIDDEIAAYVYRIARGIEVDEETLSVDVISKTGPLGSYLSHPKTITQFKREHSQARLSDRLTRQQWMSSGSKPTEERARERMKSLLADHVPEPLEPEARKGLEDLLREHAPGYSLPELERYS